MDWLKDKKNRPIIAIVLCTVFVAVIAGFLFLGHKGSDTPPAESADTTTPPSDASAQSTSTPPQPGAPSVSPAPAGATPAPTGTTAPAGTSTAGTDVAKTASVASVTPMETWRSDPFEPIGYKPKAHHKEVPPIRDFPFINLVPPKPVGGTVKKPEIIQPTRRMAGILKNDRVYAIIETTGQNEIDICHPGQMLKDGLASVEKIESDRVILKTIDKPARYITVRMASSPHTQTVNTTANPETAPGAVMPGSRRMMPAMPPGP